MNDDAIKFIKRWIEKSQSYGDHSVNDAFDKFASLFIAYNALYNLLAKEKCPSLRRDSEKAIEVPIQLGVERHVWHDEEIGVRVKCILETIATNGFYFRRNGDSEIHQNLNSCQADQFLRGIMQMIYYTRCNMFHGEKPLTVEQVTLLVHLSAILFKLVHLLPGSQLCRTNQQSDDITDQGGA